LIGHRIEALRLPFTGKVGDDDGRFFRALAMRVMKRPVLTIVIVAGFLLVLAAPFLRMTPSITDYKALPRGTPVREATEMFHTKFLQNQLTPHDLIVRVDGDLYREGTLQKLLALQEQMAALPGVLAVQSVFSAQPGVSPAGVIDGLLHQREKLDPATRELLSRFLSAKPGPDGRSIARFLVLSDSGYNTERSFAQVRALRALDTSSLGAAHPLVTGAPAVLVDLLVRLRERGPFALGFTGVAMFFVLAWAFRSVVVPLKAIVMNCLSMTASFGALVWIFQDGRFAGLLRYEPAGFTEATTPLVMFCLVFGLSMDYEVLLLGRVREEAKKNGGDTEAAVAVGLQRTGRTITSAALLLIVVVGAFGFSQVLTM